MLFGLKYLEGISNLFIFLFYSSICSLEYRKLRRNTMKTVQLVENGWENYTYTIVSATCQSVQSTLTIHFIHEYKVGL